jgi:lysophospholipase
MCLASQGDGLDDLKRVLVIYTGGTIGMVRGPKGYVPRPGFLAQTLRGMPRCHEAGQPDLTLPPSRLGRRTRYEILERDPLIDSANMAPQDWVSIARDIERHYDDYDAFVVLHGTDTMAYTACALSFMLVNLSKTVVLTGSQIPISHVRNDGVDNLLGAMVLAAHYEIPEVAIYFRDRLFRGNRCQKVDAEGFDAFDSGNLPPLARIGIGIDVRWDLVRTPQPGKLHVRPIVRSDVAALRLHPGMDATTLGRLLRPPLAGAILETYGTGNGPDNRPELLDAVRSATERGMVIVNVTQCHRGAVKPEYAVGTGLSEAGVVSGADLTPEASLTKLAYLLSHVDDPEEVKRLMAVDMRGELTPQDVPKRYSFRERQFVRRVATALDASAPDAVARALWPVLMASAAADGDLAALQRMHTAGADVSGADADGRTPLHRAAAAGQVDAIAWLLARGSHASAADRAGFTPLDEAQRANHTSAAHLLLEHGAAPGRFHALRALAASGDLAGIQSFLETEHPPSKG